MSATLALREAAEDARLAAAEAAGRAAVEIRDLRGPADDHQVVELFIEVWGTPPEAAPCSPHFLRALSVSGNYAVAAWRGEALLGASIGFLHPWGGGVALHSHITGVARSTQSGGVGFALKQHQRAWALERGLDRVDWTYDPLVRGNARFNLVKLGAEAVSYLPDLYGPMAGAINAGDESDRCLASWPLAGKRAVAAGHGHATEPDLEALQAGGAAVILAEGPDGRPAPAGASVAGAPGPPGAPGAAGPARPAGPPAGTLLAWVPADAVALRARDPGLAMAWRRALREAMSAAMRAGFVATGMTRSGWYVLERPKDRPEERP